LGARRIVYSEAEIDRWIASRTFPHRDAEAAQFA
jgi:predicted DNA-binding transcriptional regulator AlpA